MLQKATIIQILALVFMIALIVGCLMLDVSGCIELVKAWGIYGVAVALIFHGILGLVVIGRNWETQKEEK